ncbi:glycosyltransferase [Lutimaribacter sp. EGI FJ00015]|uniref:Glycosyltransferase n=1 Tax=Lutimaribacter degradans TaxID=2945989 RepID=A0ACC5ZUZ4_9RHOB|nr:glycosyltransferase [Lutimaribacter sp. EGI FJ00013]MCM2561871.1 glycosyltransferase [Lutimaribacter sp. EGI FJ00013]MCO0613097.1 glycosyltransferase [Lutimaribacter sp. EGI FJ00015]MCO0635703.1 glycosyltransferase [Lutimaribacter sp. EGI FJ00014]
MTALRASVVIVSRGRPDALCLCLAGIARLRNVEYEVIVVADPVGLAAARTLPFASDLKLVEFDRANISEARNLGIAQAAGDVVAFIDDDAVPEPRWLAHLIRPFDDARVAAASGFVRGRNGISFQWKARTVDTTGRAYPADVDPLAVTLLHPPEGRAVKTEGTNMAVRREVLAEIGGFDPAFRFYLDETDLNMRLARGGYATAIVPLAQVHHAYAPSARRNAERAVTDLHEIGASTSVYLRNHHPHPDAWPALVASIRAEQRQRLIAQMIDGRLEPRDVRQNLRRFDAGIAEGRHRPPMPVDRIVPSPSDFRFFPSLATGPTEILAGRLWSGARLRCEASQRAENGATVSLYVFSHTGLFHSVRFLPEGVWLQRGGLWGRSDRTDPLWRWWRFESRLKHEIARTTGVR